MWYFEEFKEYTYICTYFGHNVTVDIWFCAICCNISFAHCKKSEKVIFRYWILLSAECSMIRCVHNCIFRFFLMIVLYLNHNHAKTLTEIITCFGGKNNLDKLCVLFICTPGIHLDFSQCFHMVYRLLSVAQVFLSVFSRHLSVGPGCSQRVLIHSHVKICIHLFHFPYQANLT